MHLCASPLCALEEADALVVCTAWPDYLQVPVEDIVAKLAAGLIVDPAGVLRGVLAFRPGVRYVRVGSPAEILAGRGSVAPSRERARA